MYLQRFNVYKIVLDKATLNETHLWDRIKAGDKNALAEIYNLHAKALYNYGNKIFQNSQCVEDEIHDLFVDLWNYRANLGQIISGRAYLYASLRRKILKHKKNLNSLGYDYRWEELHLLTDSDEDKLIKKEFMDDQTEKLRSHLNNLSPRQYEAIILRFYEQLGYGDIATVMEVNEQSVRNLIQRGIENLRQYSRLTISLLILAQSLLLL
ncbi:MAG: sigma-70 family RNA polymerase sigma factor [Chryseolinea sp.]